MSYEHVIQLIFMYVYCNVLDSAESLVAYIHVDMSLQQPEFFIYYPFNIFCTDAVPY